MTPTMLLASGSVFGAQVSVGIRIGPPPSPRVVRVLPRKPGPEFVWVEGYWYPVGKRYKWHDGHWTRPPYPGARRVGPPLRWTAVLWRLLGRRSRPGLNMTTAGTTTGTEISVTMIEMIGIATVTDSHRRTAKIRHLDNVEKYMDSAKVIGEITKLLSAA